MGSYGTRRHIMLLRRVWLPVCSAVATPKPPHRLRNERKQAQEKEARLLKMQNDAGTDDLFRKLQDLLLPEKADLPIDRPALVEKFRLLMNLCETQHQLQAVPASSSPKSPQRKKARRDFDYSAYRTRFVAFHVLYMGWDYLGFASQDIAKTIEVLPPPSCVSYERFENSREISYSKCGRTDKGVSALGQVISVRVRSRRKIHEEAATEDEEFDYPTMLNAVLPAEIRVWGWAPVHADFSARYSPVSRSYKYFVVTDEKEGLDVELMQACCEKFRGVHNFQNFCRMNLDQTLNHEREILEINLCPVLDIQFPRHSFFTLTIKGNAFLWHQVRCMVAVLLLIGQGLETPEVIDAMLDVEQTLAKPLYTPASEVPLLLWEADYGEGVVPFRRSHCQLEKTRNLLRRTLHDHLAKLLIMHELQETLLSVEHEGPLFESRIPPHIPLLKRQSEPSFAERMERHLLKRGPA